MRRSLLLSSVLLLVACTSAGRPASIAPPSIQLRQLGPIFFGSGRSAPATIEVEVTNHAAVPLRVREIDLSSPGMAQYTLLRTRRIFSETIPPGESRTLTIPATAVTDVARLSPSEPLSLRAIVTFEANGTRFREIAHDQQVLPR
jgi:hypothetical protein